MGRPWRSFEAALRYYILEGFLYVESGCVACRKTQRVMIFPGCKVVECIHCGEMASHVTTVIEPAHG